MIAPHILFLSVILSLTWGLHLVDEVNDYIAIRNRQNDRQRRRGDLVVSFRRVIVAVSLFSFCFAYVVRTGLILLGFADNVAGQIAVFSLLGVNVLGSIFTVISRRYD